MKSLLLEFGSDGHVRLLAGVAEGFHATVQNALVNILTDAGSDRIFEERGTQLLAGVVGGSIYNMASAAHAGSFAAADTLFFSRETDTAAEEDRLADLKLVPEINAGLSYLTSFVSEDGRVLSNPLSNLNL